MHVFILVTLYVMYVENSTKEFYMYFFLDFLNGKPEVTNK